MNQELCILIDGNALAYRAYYAFKQPLINSKGKQTTLCYVFLNTIKRLIDFYSPKYFAVMFDSGKAIKRMEIYKEYKANRKKMPDEMFEQFEDLKEMINKLNIPIYEKEGVEADDILAKTALEGQNRNIKTYILTSDKDMAQIINDNIQILRPVKGNENEQHFGYLEVFQKFGVYPEQIVDYLSIVGDSSDNIPGVKGVGEKGAVKLLSEYKNLDNIYENIDNIKPESLKKKLIENKEQAYLAKQLIKLDLDIDFDLSWNHLIFHGFDKDKVIDVLKYLEFNSMIHHFRFQTSFNFQYEIIDTEKKLLVLIEKLTKSAEIAIDIESDHLDPFQARLVGISLCVEKNKGYYLPINHKKGNNINLKDLQLLNPIFKNSFFIGQNIKYDYLVLQNNGFYIENIKFDTMVASYLINPDQGHHNLDYLSEHWLGYKMKSFKDLMKEEKADDFSDVTICNGAYYSVEDVVVTFHLKEILEKKLIENSLLKLFNEIEVPLIKVLSDMESEGVYTNQKKIGQLLTEYKEEMIHLEEKIYQESGKVFNINSPKQLAEVLFDRLNLPKGKKTKTGYSTDVKVLENLSFYHPVPRMILEYRQNMKLVSTYLEPLKILSKKGNGLIHASFNQSIASTGRLTCSQPNLQNIPIKSKKGKQIRTIFMNRAQETVLFSADYSQIELRIMAHLSNDEEMIHSFEKEEDIHRDIASKIYEVSVDEVDDEMRRRAKTINFGVLYGMSAYSLSQELKITNREAKDFIEKYFSRFPKIKDFIEETIAFAQEKGYVSTIFHRKRYVPEINSSNRMRREFAKRIAVNTPVQGSAADIIKKAMIDIHYWIKRNQLPIRMILQVHDELLFEIPVKHKEDFSNKIIELMENCVILKTPLKVESGFGHTWLEAH